jgi:hypothetical protein
MNAWTADEAEKQARAALEADQPEKAEMLARALLPNGTGLIRYWQLLATSLRRQGRLEETKQIQEMLVENTPSNLELRFDLAETLLLLGEFDRGWKEYHYRYYLSHTQHLRREVQKPRWDGRPMPGKTLLIHDEQGFGDTLQFMRMVPWAKEQSQAYVVLQIVKELLPFVERLKGIDEIVLRGQVPPPFERHCEMMSLPMAMKLQTSQLPGPMPYVKPLPGRTRRWKPRLADIQGLKVAVVWAGRSNHFNDRNRSMNLSQFAPLGMEGVTFLSVQKGFRVEEAKAPPASMNFIDLGPTIEDFEDTAAIFSLVDLVISVDSSPIHLAGAMGRPVWVLLPFMPDWRWLMHRSDTPWYPSMRLFRQTTQGDWPGVMARVAEALEQLRDQR